MCNEEEFLRLIEQNEPRIRRICRAYAPEAMAREDLYQDILVQLWRSLPSFRGESTVETWLYRVALNTALGSRRSRDARREIPDAEAQTLTRDRRPLPDERAIAKQRLERLTAAIDRLSDIDKAVITLYLEDRSYAEIAEVLGISENNVGVKLHRIRKRLRSRLMETASP